MSKEKRDIDAAAPNGYYYLENGLIVFTAAYHLLRGYCCGNGCRHCPYPAPDSKKRPKR